MSPARRVCVRLRAEFEKVVPRLALTSKWNGGLHRPLGCGYYYRPIRLAKPSTVVVVAASFLAWWAASSIIIIVGIFVFNLQATPHNHDTLATVTTITTSPARRVLANPNRVPSSSISIVNIAYCPATIDAMQQPVLATWRCAIGCNAGG